MSNRRKLIVALSASALAAPFGTFAQTQGKVPRIGYLTPFPPNKDPQFDAFKQQLRDLGHVHGKTIAIDYLSAEGKYDRLPALAAELVRRKVDVIMAAGGTPSATAARNAARTIPVVFAGVGDPVGQGFVTSLARPGGNVTGITNQSPEVAAKALALLKEIIPSAKRIAILSNPKNSSLLVVLSEMQAAAKTLRLEVTVVNARAPVEFEEAFAEVVRAQSEGVVILADALFTSEAGRLATLAATHRLPTMGLNGVVPEGGGLMSYGANRLDLVRRAAILVDKILKGAKPADIPVEQPTSFELIVNSNNARAIGIKIPQSILVRADTVIE